MTSGRMTEAGNEAPEPNPPIEARIIGRYELVREIGRGAMARVYLARDTFSEREVAIKVANPDAEPEAKRARLARKLFLNEARAAALLRHPGIVAVYDAGAHDDLRYIAMEYVAGAKTLQAHCAPSTLLPVEEVVRLMLRCAVALDYAHRKGVIHRDIKPKNLLLSADQEIKLGDFGIALLTEVDVDDTQVIGYLGSPLYMSPEQIRGETLTNQSDLFALGVVLYELLAGTHPFGASTLQGITRNILREPHVPVHELRPDVPPVLSRIVDRILKKHPAGRYATGLDVAGDLSLVADELHVPQQTLAGQRRFAALRRLDFFESFDDADVWEVLNAAVWQELADDTEIVGPDDALDAFYVLVEGRARVRHGGTDIDSLQAGDCFGEFQPGQRGEPRLSIVARGAATVIQIRRTFVATASTGCQLSLSRALLGRTKDRLARTTLRLSEALERAPSPAEDRLRR